MNHVWSQFSIVNASKQWECTSYILFLIIFFLQFVHQIFSLYHDKQREEAWTISIWENVGRISLCRTLASWEFKTLKWRMMWVKICDGKSNAEEYIWNYWTNIDTCPLPLIVVKNAHHAVINLACNQIHVQWKTIKEQATKIVWQYLHEIV